jgi:sugar-specific transcriptional regulator TrmB
VEEPLMFPDEEYVQTLMGLELTLLQAKTYLALVKLGSADVKTISKISSVARQDIYRVIPKLQKLGLAEKVISTPTMYKAIPLKTGLSILLQQKIDENAELQEKTGALINDFEKHFDPEKVVAEDEPQFIITSERTVFHKRITDATDTAQKSKDAIISYEGCKAMLFDQNKHITKALNRGVKIRIITEKPEKQQAIQKLNDLKKNHFFNIKYTFAPPICMMIFDNQEVHLRMAEGAVPSLWSSNPNIVSLSQKYFDELWSKI